MKTVKSLGNVTLQLKRERISNANDRKTNKCSK